MFDRFLPILMAPKCVLVVDVTTLQMARKPVKILKENPGKVNRVKEIRRREKDGLMITDNSIM